MIKRRQLEKISDRSIGIAIALLILVFSLPIKKVASQHNWAQWVPHLAIFGFSFLMICVFWTAQSKVIGLIIKPVLSKKIVWLNGLYLFFLVLLPLSSILIAGDPYLPAYVLLYSCHLLLISLLHLLLLNAVLKLSYQGHQQLTRKVQHSLKKLALAGPALYIISIAVSYINAYISFTAIIAALCFYAFLLNKSMQAKCR